MSKSKMQELEVRIAVLEAEVRKLVIDSHPPVAIVDCVKQAIKDGTLRLHATAEGTVVIIKEGL